MAVTDDAVSIGVAGIGGYAGNVSDLILNHGAELPRPVRLLAACDPDLDRHAERIETLRGHGVSIFPTYEQLLAAPGLDAVWLPLPIPLHRPFAEQALAAGKAVIIEKPAAGSIDDVDAMIAARDRAGLPAIVGFQDIYDVTTAPLKRRILSGEFGRITHATLHACWPRNDQYFGRSAWAGRQRVSDAWVLDSPANNALAHPVNTALFLLGPTLESSITPTSVEAELYRAADIENYDTLSARATLQGGATFLILLTHATATTIQPRLVLHGERGRIIYEQPRITVEVDGKTQVIERTDPKLVAMLRCVAHVVRGEQQDESVPATLEVARQHTMLINGISEAAPVVTVPADAIRSTVHGPGTVRAIVGIEEAFEHCAQQGQMLHESGRLSFTSPAGTRDLRGYDYFAGPKPSAHEPVASTQ